MTKPSASVFDIDGTVADDRWRRSMIVGDDYDRYHEASKEDQPINQHLVRTRASVGDCIIFATSRPERHRKITTRWLAEHFTGEFVLVMRDNEDTRPSPHVKTDMLEKLKEQYDIRVVFDDREDVCELLQVNGYETELILTCCDEQKQLVALPWEDPQQITAARLLRTMAKTFEDRNAQYGDNWRMVPQLVKVLFPKGVPQWLLTDPRWHLFELKLVKLTRFAISELRHVDSIHDDGVYSAMIESIIHEEQENEA